MAQAGLSHRGERGWIPVLFIWNLCWTKWHCDRVFSECTPPPPRSESFHQYSNRIFSPLTLYISQLQRRYPITASLPNYSVVTQLQRRYLRHKRINLVEIREIRSSELLRCEVGGCLLTFLTGV